MKLQQVFHDRSQALPIAALGEALRRRARRTCENMPTVATFALAVASSVVITLAG